MIILASKENYLLDKGYDLLGFPRGELKIGIINTAFKAVKDQEYIQYMNDYYSAMDASGLDYKMFDIEGKGEEEILAFFADRNVIQVTGGNPFYLLKAVRESGFASALNKLLERGLNYIGCSSGSYLMCPTIEVGGWKPGRNLFGITDPTALNYVPFLIKCHFKDEEKENLIERSKGLKYQLRALKDDQCFILEDGNVRFVGSSETILQ